jgi:hypothetical protein
MHTHIARRHQRHARELRKLLQTVQLQSVVRAQARRNRQPQIQAKQGPSPRSYCASRFHIDSRWQGQKNLATLQLRPQRLVLRAAPAHLVFAFGRRPPRHGDEFTQIAPALQMVRQGNDGKARIRAGEAYMKFGSQQQFQTPRARFSRLAMPATEHSSVMASAL